MRLIDADACWDRILNGCCYTTEAAIMGTPTIDPVHAAGACYCKECKYHDDEVYPGTEWELNDHQECWCNWWDSVMSLNGFCSEGRKDDIKNETI